MRDSTSILSRYAKRLFGASATTSRRRRDAVRRRDHLPLHTPAEVLEERSLLSGVVAYWAAENTAVDAVGANNGALINGATYSAGQMGQAFSFDGVNDRVQVADSASLKLTASMSIEGWVKADSVPVPGQQGEILFRGDDRGGLDPYSLSVQSSGGLRFEVVSLSAAVSVSTPMPLGQFVHIAATLDDASGAMSLYLNGVLMSQTTTTVRPFGDLDPASNPSIGIGNHGGYPTSPHNFPFAALIDELKVYDQALTATDVLADFNAGKGSLQPKISISDTTIVEGDTSIHSLGAFVSATDGGMYDPHSLVYGPDGALYVSTRFNNGVLRYDASTGAPLPAPGKTGAEFVSPGAGGLTQARGLAFGPDGNLYVVSTDTDSILRYSANTGEYLGAFVGSGVGGLDVPRGLLFHSDGHLYVTSVGGTTAAAGMDSILRFDSVTGAPAGLSGLPGDAVFIATGSGGMDNPSVIISHGGDFYVSSTSPSTSNSVLRYGADGTFLGAFVPAGSGGLSGPYDLVFRDGSLYVTSWANNKILRYDGASGAFVSEVASGGGLARPIGLVFDANGNILVSSGDANSILRYGASSQAVFTVNLSAPFATTVSVDFSTANGTAGAGSDYATANGTLIFAPGVTTKIVLVQTFDDTNQEIDETFVVNLTNATGGVITDSQGVATIRDNETKFLVVNDGSPDLTYTYGSSGVATGNTALASGNTAPRGAASNAAGTMSWVVDANRNVNVYNSAGTSLGSWTASNFGTTAQLEGIAVDPTIGTDVWILDNKSDKVYRYTGAESRISGSQNAASSFSLNSGNKNGKGIVTDGTSLWVVNDSTTDKVFKYSLTGTLLGSWTIDTANYQPTGLTIDPTNVSNIWIVDSGADKVFQYNGAATRTSGSQTAAASFALAAGNTNPQDIADPPVGLAAPLAPAFGGRIDSVPAFAARGPTNADLDSLFATLAANYDLSGTGDEWSGTTHAGGGHVRGRARLHQRVS